MIAQINIQTRECRCFDIRKLSPRECLILMGVPKEYIDRMMQKAVRTYKAIDGCEVELALLGLDDAATAREIREAAEELLNKQNEEDEDESNRVGEEQRTPRQGAEIQNQECGELPDILLRRQQLQGQGDGDGEHDAVLADRILIEQARDRLLAAPRVERTALVQRISNSSLYKLAGNSIACDVLMMIYEEAFFPTGRRMPFEQYSLFYVPQFSLQRDWQEKPCKLLTLCSGYDSQAIAMEMLKEKYPDFDYRLVAWAEYDPESSRPIDEQPAVMAHNLNFPTWQGRNLGDMTKIDWPKWTRDNDIHPGDIDLLTYSTPCTDISQAGKRAGIAKGSGTRSSILWSTEDAIAHLKPKMALQENVRALINKENMPHFREWCRVLESHGYVNFLPPSFPKADCTMTIAGVLNARDYGVPQNRDRVFMLSIRKDVLGDTQYEFPRPFPLTKTIADILEDDAPASLFLKPQSVEAFLRKNEDNQEYIYVVTDHKPTAEEVERMIEKAGK